MLLCVQSEQVEAGCDEAGRGPLAGPVFGAAVILPSSFHHPLLNDSKQVSEKNRILLREYIEQEALAWAVASVHEQEIDSINILQASILAVHKSIDQLSIIPEWIAMDGNYFKNYHNIPHQCIVKGDSKYQNIAAASILAKTYRDEWMQKIHEEFPVYGWAKNKGYPTKAHREAIQKYGPCKYHRKSFRLLSEPK